MSILDMKLAGYQRAVELLKQHRAEIMNRAAPYGRCTQEMRLLFETEDFLRMMDEMPRGDKK